MKIKELFEGEEISLDIDTDKKEERFGYVHIHFFCNDVTLGIESETWKSLKKDLIALGKKLGEGMKEELDEEMAKLLDEGIRSHIAKRKIEKK